MPQTCYCVGIDLGTTYSAAAVYRDGETRPETVPLGGSTAAVASMVYLAPDGSMLCGEGALRRAVTDPRLVIREFKRRIGDGTPLVVGGRPVAAESVAARFVAWILERVAEREGGPPERIALTHPAEWGRHKRDSVAAALAAEGVIGVMFLTEPEAAAIGYASTERVDIGGTVAVYDLGGGTFDAAVVRKLPDDGFEITGKPVGIERLGGVDFDEVVFDHVRMAIGDAWNRLDPADPAVRSAVAALRRECTSAKEALSADTEVMVQVMLPGHHSQVRIGRAEFEEQIRPAAAETLEALRRAIASAGATAAGLAAVLMVGGSSRIPLIKQLVSAELDRPIALDADPKSVIAVGAAVAARGRVVAVAPVSFVKGAHVPGIEGGSDVRPLAPAGSGPVPRAVPQPRRNRTLLAAAAALVVTAVVGLGVAAAATGGDPAGTSAEVAAVAQIPNPPTVAAPPVDILTGAEQSESTLPGPQPLVLAADPRPEPHIDRTGTRRASPAAGTAARTASVRNGAATTTSTSMTTRPEPEPTDSGSADHDTDTDESDSSDFDPDSEDRDGSHSDETPTLGTPTQGTPTSSGDVDSG